MFIDTHAHFDICINEGETEGSLLSAMKDNDVKFAVQVGVDAENMLWSSEFAAKHENIYYTLGIHPASSFRPEDIERLKKNAESSSGGKLIGIGETGLDYHWMEHPREVQIELFEKQAEIAIQNNLALIVHSRDAMDDTISVLKNMHPERVIIHCFSGNASQAGLLAEMGCHISFAGNLTYKKADNLHEALKSVPLNRLLFETDCPYLSPVPNRGKKNRPDYVVHTYAFAADLLEVETDELCGIVEENFSVFADINKK